MAITVNIPVFRAGIAEHVIALQETLAEIPEVLPNPYADVSDLELLLILSTVITDEQIEQMQKDAAWLLHEALRRMAQYHRPEIDQNLPTEF